MTHRTPRNNEGSRSLSAHVFSGIRSATVVSTRPSKLTRGTKPWNENNTHYKVISEEVQEGKESEFHAGWKNPMLTRMDALYPVSRTNRILRKSNFSITLKRLVNTFRILNLHTTFYNSPNVGASCRSLDLVELSVNLWESCHDPDGMILEIYRISGDTIVYSNYARRIFGDVAGNQSSPADAISNKRKNATRNSTCGAILHSTLLPASSNMVSDALRPVWSMLLEGRLDSRCRGLESLVTLTEVPKTDKVVATAVANVLLRGSDRNMKGCVMIGELIHQTIFHLVSYGQWPDSNIKLVGKLVYQDELPVHLALMALANASSLLMYESSDVSWSTGDAASDMVDEHSFGLAMEYFVANAHQDPHAAYQALRIWTFLLSVQPAVEHSHVTVSAVRKAQQIGHRSHVALALQAKLVLAALES